VVDGVPVRQVPAGADLAGRAREGEVEAVDQNGILEVRVPLNDTPASEGSRVAVTPG
jgi:hypothetical protein